MIETVLQHLDFVVVQEPAVIFDHLIILGVNVKSIHCDLLSTTYALEYQLLSPCHKT